MSEIVVSGKPFNPMSGADGQGRAYSDKTAEKLLIAMKKNGWTDPRFLTEPQIDRLGLSLVEDAKRAVVLYKEDNESAWQTMDVYNGTQIVGLQSLADMVLGAQKRLGIGVTFADLAVSGKPFNPVSAADGQGRMYSGNNLATLSEAMSVNGWTDPRFLTKAQITANGWSIDERQALGVAVWVKGGEGWREALVFNASAVVGIKTLEQMTAEAAALLSKVKVGEVVEKEAAENSVMGNASQAEVESLLSGVVMNPLSGASGKIFSGRNAEKLLAVMAEQGWADGRFLTAKQAEQQGWTLAENARSVEVSLASAGAFVSREMYNSADIIGMPSMASMYSRIGNLPSEDHATMALAGLPFDPLSDDAHRLVSLPGAYDALVSAMEKNGWKDPRFISHYSMDAPTGSLPVVIAGEFLCCADQIHNFPKMANLETWQALYDQETRLEKEQQKARDTKVMDGVVETVTAVGVAAPMSLSEAYTQFWGRPPVKLAPEMLADVLTDAHKLGVKVSAEKVAEMLSTGAVPDGIYIGEVLGVNEEHGVVFQSQGRGRVEVLPLASLSLPIGMIKVGEKMSVDMHSGVGAIQTRGASAALGRD